MPIESLFDRASSIMTVISFLTFMGILAWTFLYKRSADFADAAALPFGDEEQDHV